MNLDYIALYSQLELYSGGMPGHTTPTVLSCDETIDYKETGRSGAAINLTAQFMNLTNLVE